MTKYCAACKMPKSNHTFFIVQGVEYMECFDSNCSDVKGLFVSKRELLEMDMDHSENIQSKNNPPEIKPSNSVTKAKTQKSTPDNGTKLGDTNLLMTNVMNSESYKERSKVFEERVHDSIDGFRNILLISRSYGYGEHFKTAKKGLLDIYNEFKDVTENVKKKEGCGKMFFNKRISRTSDCNKHHLCDACDVQEKKP